MSRGVLMGGHCPGAAEDWMLWLDLPDCPHIADPDGCCEPCFQEVARIALDEYMDAHPEAQPRNAD